MLTKKKKEKEIKSFAQNACDVKKFPAGISRKKACQQKTCDKHWLHLTIAKNCIRLSFSHCSNDLQFKCTKNQS